MKNMRRPFQKVVAAASSFFVFLLFTFPNYCDRCSYRDVTRILASLESEGIPPCCAGGAPAKEPSGGSGNRDDHSQATHTSVPYCIGSTLASVTVHRDVLEEIRRAVTPSRLMDSTGAFVRLSIVLDHKEARAPPA